MLSVGLSTVSTLGTFQGWKPCHWESVQRAAWQPGQGEQSLESGRPGLKAWLQKHVCCVTVTGHSSSGPLSPCEIVVKALSWADQWPGHWPRP